MKTITEQRARLSRGSSHETVYALVARVVAGLGLGPGARLLDVGCGAGRLWPCVRTHFAHYTGVDLIRYDGFPEDGEFHAADLEAGVIDLPDAAFDVVAVVETIEHLDGPRRFVRELARLVQPGGWLIVTTPNQLSLVSLLYLALRHQFHAFQEAPGLYPAHRTALLETDLVRIAREQGLIDITINYTDRGRIPLTGRHWPRPLKGRRFSDNVLLAARRSACPAGSGVG
jgi:2-polyprenyl-3-methyl-5-hydroxy-6-metoxy-1,4-benzoquinol methylase